MLVTPTMQCGGECEAASVAPKRASADTASRSFGVGSFETSTVSHEHPRGRISGEKPVNDRL
ncbi:hypothetical protein GCM10008096_16270 [Zhihengliuella salsuginis]|uniref:Uncharacterized protein n=1 Tax=Zhihengliuella salsuginis TaxID=578222 RepID=A0ABQ3GHL7_9MICC|nr:hypothetical protein GCM10008096_16270 [Zhihengliuella salsuginis]